MVDVEYAPVRGFVSYRRVDDEDFDQVVQRIHRILPAMYEAETGQRLDLFLDRESIGWGEDWRSKISESVSKATVFIPIVTLRYFNSQICMEELTAFEASARSLGVTDLVLPIVLFGADQIKATDERAEVRMIARLNYKSIQAAWLAGYRSPRWRTAMFDCANSLADAIHRSEETLTEALASGAISATIRVPSSPGGGESVQDQDDLDQFIDLAAMTERITQVTEKLGAATRLIEEMGAIANSISGDELNSLSPGQVNARLLRVANEFRGPSMALEVAGHDVETSMLDLDSQLRTLVNILRPMNSELAREQLGQLLVGLPQELEMQESRTEVIELIESIQIASLANITLRKALRPAIRGLRSFLNAIEVFQGWSLLRTQLN